MRTGVVIGIVAATMLLVGGPSVRAQAGRDPQLIIERIVDHVTRYYARAQSLIGHEEITQQPIRTDMSFDGPSTRYGYQLRLEWAPAEAHQIPTATMIRELLTVNGRPPKLKDKPRCMQPHETWSEPLAMFLPDERKDLEFKWAGTGRMDGRPTVSLDFMHRERRGRATPEASFRTGADDSSCVSWSVESRLQGRVWLDDVSGEVLRLDQNVYGPIDIDIPREEQKKWRTTALTIDRHTSSIRYKPVTFEDPVEVIMLPESIQTITLSRGGAQSIRVTQRFKNYRRFLGSGRLLEE